MSAYRLGVHSIREKEIDASDAVFVFKYNRYWYKTVTYYSLIGNVNILLLFSLLWSKDSFISFHETFKLTFRRKITVVRRLTDISYNNLYSKNNVQF